MELVLLDLKVSVGQLKRCQLSSMSFRLPSRTASLVNITPITNPKLAIPSLPSYMFSAPSPTKASQSYYHLSGELKTS